MINWKGSVPLPPLEYISSWIDIQLINLPDTTYPLGYKKLCVFYYYFALRWIYAYSVILGSIGYIIPVLQLPAYVQMQALRF